MKFSRMVTLAVGMVFMVGCSGTSPSTIGLAEKGLKDCPNRPNCVSSKATDKERFVEPFSYACQKDVAFEALIRIVSGQKRATIVEKTGDYIHVEFRSKLFRFVDDVEFYLPDDEPVVHLRSASRLGYSDMGVNRKRVDLLRNLFMDATSI